jgi:hypothetical protein
MLGSIARRGAALATAVAVLGAACASAQAIPIPSVAVPAPAPYIGAPVAPDPIHPAYTAPQNPFMAQNGDAEIHNDGWQTDAYAWAGPLGRSPRTLSSTILPPRDCGSITFDAQGRVVAICIGVTGPELFMFDPRTLATLATFALPLRTAEDLLLNPNIFQDFSNGGYFYLDSHDQVVTGTTTRHIYVIAETGTAAKPGFKLAHDYNLSNVLHADEEITSQLPDSHGLLWFTARRDAVVGTLNLSTGAVHVVRLGHGTDGEITKSLAVDASGGVYIPTNHELYRFVAGPGGKPQISWQAGYPNDGVAKPGQLDAGTGTTPVVSGPFVAINDNADPMDVVVYRNAVHPTRTVRVRAKVHGRRRWRTRRIAAFRMVCAAPVFSKGNSADENAMIAAGNSFVIENNYGYVSPVSTAAGALTQPGFARVDVNSAGTGCRLVWTNRSERAPSVVSKLSLQTGLIYTYTIEPGVMDPWYWTAIDFRTGRVVWRRYAGAGLGYNNNYSGIAISPTGTEYLGTLGGLIALRDG